MMRESGQKIPKGAARLTADLGAADALRVMEAIGGATWEIPVVGKLNLISRLLVERVGMRLADKLASHYGGGRIYIPRAAAIGKAARNARILDRFREELAGGGSRTYAAAVVALEFDITSSSVIGIVRANKEEVTHDKA